MKDKNLKQSVLSQIRELEAVKDDLYDLYKNLRESGLEGTSQIVYAHYVRIQYPVSEIKSLTDLMQ